MDDIFDQKAMARLEKEHRAMLDRWVENAIERDAAIDRNLPYCPNCGTRQVQIMDKSVPAKWKCRMCKWRFEHEGPR